MRWLLAALLALLITPAIAHAGTTRLLQTNCAPVASQGDRLYFNTRQANGLFDARVGSIADCSGGQPLLPAHDGHRGVGDVAGDLVLFETALGPDRKASYAEPGKGFGMQLQLLNRSTGVLSQLTTGRKAIIWSKLRPDGGAVTWAQMYKTNLEADWFHNPLGLWELHVADIQNGQLVNERSWRNTTGTGRDSEPGDEGFLETYGWQGDRLMFASDQGVGPYGWGDWLVTQLWTIPANLSTGPTRVSAPFKVPTWCSGASWCSVWFTEENPYHEFMHVVDGWLYFGVVWDRDLPARGEGGLDLWRQRLDGSSRQRVTKFNATAYANVGALAPDRTRPGRLVMGVTPQLDAKELNAYEVIP